MLSNDAREDHEKDCPYHFVQCFDLTCKVKVSLSDFPKHWHDKKYFSPVESLQFGEKLYSMVITGMPFWENENLMGQLEHAYIYPGREDLLFYCEFVRFRNKW